jgi:hypothetical protein
MVESTPLHPILTPPEGGSNQQMQNRRSPAPKGEVRAQDVKGVVIKHFYGD